EGQTFLGMVTVNTNTSCQGTFQVALPFAVPRGRFITATVTNPAGNTSEFSEAVQVIVRNAPPDCSLSRPSIETIWPPNHAFVAIDVLGVSDPDGDRVSVTVDGITQDEPVRETDAGSGNTCPDATGVGTNTALVRAERAGTSKVPGNGRVYHIGYTAA